MKKSLFAIVLLSVFNHSSFAQRANVKKYTTPLCGTVILKNVDDKYNALIYSLEMPEPDAQAEQKKLAEIKAKMQKTFPRQRSAVQERTTSVGAPVVFVSYVSDSMSGIPPDNYSAVSDSNKSVCVMNDLISVHNATTGAFLTRKTLSLFSTSIGLSPGTYYRYDPKVVYDPQADRFICIMLCGTNATNYIAMGFSNTNDPSGSWAFYKFPGNFANDTTWFDYPAISITQNEVFFTGNKIKNDSSWQAGFKESVIYQVRKADGYNAAATLTYQIWDSVQYNNQPLRCLYPLNPGDGIQGPSQYFLSNRDFDVTNDSVFLVKVPDTIGSSSNILTVTPLVSATSYGVPPDGRQPDTSVTLATNDGRVLGGFITANQIQFVSTTVVPATGASGIYHGIISNYSTAPVLQGQIFTIDTLDMGYPNISYAGNVSGSNEAIISFDYSGPATYPSYGAIFYDGSTYSDMTNIKSGDSSIKILSGKEQRWGDYSGSQPQWNALGVVWVEGIYGRKDHTYGNYLAQLASPTFTGVPVVRRPAATSNLYPNPAIELVSLEFNVDQEQLFSFVIYDAQGRIVDKLLDKFCTEGKNVIQFNVAPLLQGTYFVKATGDKGENIAAHTFVRR